MIRFPSSFLSIAKAMAYHQTFGLDIISPVGCISSRPGVYLLRFDDIQHSVLVICNFFEIDYIQSAAGFS